MSSTLAGISGGIIALEAILSLLVKGTNLIVAASRVKGPEDTAALFEASREDLAELVDRARVYEEQGYPLTPKLKKALEQADELNAVLIQIETPTTNMLKEAAKLANILSGQLNTNQIRADVEGRLVSRHLNAVASAKAAGKIGGPLSAVILAAVAGFYLTGCAAFSGPATIGSEYVVTDENGDRRIVYILPEGAGYPRLDAATVHDHYWGLFFGPDDPENPVRLVISADCPTCPEN